MTWMLHYPVRAHTLKTSVHNHPLMRHTHTPSSPLFLFLDYDTLTMDVVV